MPEYMQMPRLALFLEVSLHWGRAIAKGVFHANRTVTGWRSVLLATDEQLNDSVFRASSQPHWVGVIGQFYPKHAAALARLHELGVPTVNVSSWEPPKSTLWVHNDDEACGELVADFFGVRGYRNFAFAGFPETAFSIRRFHGFANALNARGVNALVDITPPAERRESMIEFTAPKLIELPIPCAVFACNDQRARHILASADAAGIDVPERLSIIGVDDDDLLCEISHIPLSSVRNDFHRIGEQAVKLLFKQSGKAPQGFELKVPPIKIVERRSSSATATDDPMIARMISYIQDNIDGDLDSDSMASFFGFSRRSLERHLVREIGQTSRKAIQSARMRRAYERVVGTSLSFGRIASLAGFSKQSQFNAAFKRTFNRTPGQARKGVG